MSALSVDACHERSANLRTNLRTVSSGRSFQIICHSVSGPLCSAVSVSAPGTSSHGSPHVGVVKMVQVWAVWRPGVLVSEVWAVLAEPFLLFSCNIRFWKWHFRQFGVHQANTAFVQSCVLNKWSTFGAKIFVYFWDIAIFVLGHFILPHPGCITQRDCVSGADHVKVLHNTLMLHNAWCYRYITPWCYLTPWWYRYITPWCYITPLPVTAPHIWNSLPQHVTSAPSLAIFRSRLKTHLFRRCFPWLRRSLVVPEKWHVITVTLIVFITYLLNYLLTLLLHNVWCYRYITPWCYITPDVTGT